MQENLLFATATLKVVYPRKLGKNRSFCFQEYQYYYWRANLKEKRLFYMKKIWNHGSLFQEKDSL